MTEDCHYGVCIQEKKCVRMCAAQALEGTVPTDSDFGEMTLRQCQCSPLECVRMKCNISTVSNALQHLGAMTYSNAEDLNEWGKTV